MKSLPISTREDRQAFIEDQLHDFNYVYKHPERRVSENCSCSQMLKLTLIKIARGAFRSALVSQAYSKHLRKLSSATNRYHDEPQIGALALAAAAVCQPTHCS